MWSLLPHQVRAAVLGTQGLQEALLCCEEVGLWKTVIAGLVICEKMARGGKNVLIVCPANLRQQWKNKLWDKFGIEARVMGGADGGRMIAVFDEAHRLRNFYKDDVVIAKSLYELTAGAFKILLTATAVDTVLHTNNTRSAA